MNKIYDDARITEREPDRIFFAQKIKKQYTWLTTKQAFLIVTMKGEAFFIFNRMKKGIEKREKCKNKSAT